MQNFNQMSLQTGGNGVNPLVQAQMMNELKYRRLYEEERHRNENLERKMTSLIDRIERHTENNMKIKANYSKEIEHLRYQASMLERENEDLRMNQQRGGEGLQRQLEEMEKNNFNLQSQVKMLENDLEMTRMNLEQESRKQGGNPEKEIELQGQVDGLRMQLQRNEEELRIAKGMVEEERHKGGRERNELEVERHKMELNIEHWKGQTEQMQREIQGLREMLDYEKGSKMRLEDRIRDLENRSMSGRWNGNNYGQNGAVQDNKSQRESNRNYQPTQDYNKRLQDQNKNNYNNYGQRNRIPSPPKKQDIVFGKPSYPAKRGLSPGMGQNREHKRSNSPFAINQKLNIYGQKNNTQESNNFRGNVGSNKEKGGYTDRAQMSSSNRGNLDNKMGSGSGGGGGQHHWNSARQWGNNGNISETQDTGGLDSIASKRMAVRRGRGI